MKYKYDISLYMVNLYMATKLVENEESRDIQSGYGLKQTPCLCFFCKNLAGKKLVYLQMSINDHFTSKKIAVNFSKTQSKKASCANLLKYAICIKIYYQYH